MKISLSILLIIFAFQLEAQNKNCKIRIEYVDIGTNYQISYPQSYPNIDDIKNDRFKRDTCISQQSLLRELVKLVRNMENNMIPCQGNDFLNCRLKDGRIVISIEGKKTNIPPLFIGKSGNILYMRIKS